jgi:AraC-like DNA-binding protein
MMKERIAEMETVANAGLVETARHLLGAMIFVPNCSPSLLARRLGLAMRTMNRRLADEGASYQQLRDEVCITTAHQLLATTKKSASEIGQMLGYSDASAFTRAFRRWSGVPPTQWRASRHQ